VASQPVLQYQLQVQGSVPPPSYHSIPGTMLAHVSSDQAAPPTYEEAIDPHGRLFLTLCVITVLPWTRNRFALF